MLPLHPMELENGQAIVRSEPEDHRFQTAAYTFNFGEYRDAVVSLKPPGYIRSQWQWVFPEYHLRPLKAGAPLETKPAVTNSTSGLISGLRGSLPVLYAQGGKVDRKRVIVDR